jgi:hypothetical protein
MRRAAVLATICTLCALSPAAATSLRFPPSGAALFTVALPAGWKARKVDSTNEIRASSAGENLELRIRSSEASIENRSIDDEVARLLDRSFTKLEFSNLHQRWPLGHRRFVVFRGSGRERPGGAKTSFEIFTFAAGGKTGLLVFTRRASAANTEDVVQAIVESVASD